MDEEIRQFKDEIKQCDDYALIELMYPRTDNKIKAIHVSLMDVRSADDIRIEYDFDRDGWIIKQAQIFEWGIDDDICDSKWIEVAFIKAWGSEIQES